MARVYLALAIGGALGLIVVRIASPAPFLPVAFGFGPAAMGGFTVMGLSWSAIGAFLVWRRPENAVGLLMVVAGAGYALTMFFVAISFAFAAEGTPGGDRQAELAGWATVLANQIGAFGFLILFIFPTGRAQSTRWAWFTRFAALMMLTTSAVVLVQPGPLYLAPSLDNPFGLGPDLRGDQLFSPLLTVFTLIAAPAIPLTLVTRFRMAGHTERQQLKWFALAGVVSIAGVGFAGWGAVLSGGAAGEIGLVVYSFGATVVPIAIAIAILRHNLYDIDRIVSRTIGYAVVSVILGGVFLAGVFVGQAVLSGVVGDDSTVAVAASTLVAFALFQPLRRRVQAAVDRRFHRARIDAERTSEMFAARLRDEVDLAALRSVLVTTASDAVRPVRASVWVRVDEGRR